MKKFIPLSAILVIWAASAMASENPPYSETFRFNPFFSQQIIDQPSQEVEIYPNPVTEGRLTVKSGESFRSIQIMNITGEIVFSQEYPSGTNSEVIELEKLEKGIYLIRIGFAGKANHTSKIIVK